METELASRRTSNRGSTTNDRPELQWRSKVSSRGGGGSDGDNGACHNGVVIENGKWTVKDGGGKSRLSLTQSFSLI
ncbi:hypothetical protein V6N12_023429 [Hibiscus sabdariffa]|uniref:Uncharacterized protein n=1 Tax=Hibiscus sabdariffa TaxID=183260 RepID=A0ABR2FXN7_9ROSI